MSQENVERLSRAIDAFNRRDIDAFLALLDREVEFAPIILGVEGGAPYRGHDDVMTWWENVHGIFPDFNAELDEVRDLGDMAVARTRLRGHGTESGTPVEQTLWLFAQWRGKKCVRWGMFESEAEALEAAGPSGSFQA